MKTPAEITLEWRRLAEMPAALLYALLRFRQAIFVVEQEAAYEDLDGHDVDAHHLLLRVDGELAGCLRVYLREGQVRIGRVAVAPAQRGRGLARRLMDEAMRLIRQQYPDRRLGLSAQAHLRAFYEDYGFVAVSPEYDDAGVPHIDMERPCL